MFMRSDSSSLRPKSLRLTFKVDGEFEQVFKNEAGGGK